MNLPNYFLADLPPEATLTPTIITEACQALKHNRRQYLADRSTESVIEALAEVARNWLEPDDPIRRLALGLGPKATGFPVEVLATGLDTFFSGLTAESLEALVVQDVGDLHRLERMTAEGAVQGADRAALVHGPELLVHITGGLLPNPALSSMIVGLLARSAQLVKCASGTSLIPRLFGHSLHELEPKLGACLEIAEWKGGTQALEAALFAEAECVTATGDNATLAALRQQMPANTRFLGYGHRVSFGYVTGEVLSGFSAQKVAARAARDVASWNQLGCLSPQVIYVETGGRTTPELFAELLANELAFLEQTCPRGPLPPPAAAAIAVRRYFYAVRAANSLDTRLWCSPGSTAWTVVYENEPLFQASCLNRFVYVKAVAGLTHALQGAAVVGGQVSTVGLAAIGNKAQALATQLARWGATRVCPLGQMQNPPLTWRHDGRPSLGELVTWTDWEMPAR
jgi:hypothetical protein